MAKVQKRSNRVKQLPQAVDETAGRRLKTLRTTKQMHASDVTCLGIGTLYGYENHSIASMKLGDLFALAEVYGLTPHEFFDYLFDAEAALPSQASMVELEAVALVRRVDAPAKQQILLNVIRSLSQELSTL